MTGSGKKRMTQSDQWPIAIDHSPKHSRGLHAKSLGFETFAWHASGVRHGSLTIECHMANYGSGGLRTMLTAMLEGPLPDEALLKRPF